MSVVSKIQDRIAHEDERIRNLEAEVPKLRERFEMATAHADQVEANLLMNEAVGDVMNSNGDVTDETLRRAKVAERERQRALESSERELRLARLVRDRLHTALQTLQDEDVDGQLRELDERAPQVAERLAAAWGSYVSAAEEADELRQQHRRLKARIPVRGVSLGLTNPVVRFPRLEEVRAKDPRQAQHHPASVLRKHGYTELADRLMEGR